MKEPVVDIPKDFDKYDAKITDKTKISINGVEGNIIYDYLIVPRHQGKFEIPPVTMTYYDVSQNKYQTLKTESFVLDVAKGSGSSKMSNYTGQEDVQALNKDIRHIRLGNRRQHAIGDFFFGSVAYWVTLAVLSLIFLSLFIIFRQRAIDHANVGKMRGKKANKVATKRLKIARRLMQDNRPSEFYDEVLRALWGYVGDKLNIPVEQLSHDNINQRLSERQVDESTITLFMGALDECEFERYAPGDPKGNMNKVFEKAMTAIEKIEESYKSYKSGKTTRSVIVFLLLMLPVGMHGVTKAEADSAYTSGHYQRAIKEYQTLLKNGVSADLYYNLGNAYYRSEEITQAIIAYERALQLAPGDKDIRFNLQMARNKTIDKITPETEMFFITWYHSVVNLMGVDGWAQMALVSLAIAIVLALLYLFSDLIWLRKLGFFGALLLLAVFFLSNLFAWQQKEAFTHRRSAVITVPAVAIKSTPAKNGTDLFILHEGTKVTITDNAMKDWKEIRIADGKEGWIETEKLEMI